MVIIINKPTIEIVLATSQLVIDIPVMTVPILIVLSMITVIQGNILIISRAMDRIPKEHQKIST